MSFFQEPNSYRYILEAHAKTCIFRQDAGDGIPPSMWKEEAYEISNALDWANYLNLKMIVELTMPEGSWDVVRRLVFDPTSQSVGERYTPEKDPDFDGKTFALYLKTLEAHKISLDLLPHLEEEASTIDINQLIKLQGLLEEASDVCHDLLKNDLANITD
jgi:hypothetical protein